MKYLDNLLDSSKYSKQKCALKAELETFLGRLSPQKSLYTALPEDVRKFLIFKESNGKTQLHVETCIFKGMPGKKDCSCPKSLASKTVDSLIGKLRAIFRDIGREREWNPTLFTGNTAASYILKRHLQSVNIEQSSAKVVRKQAVPLMFEKLGKLCRYLAYKISVEKDSVTKFLYLRDRVYFSLLFHTEDRASDLGALSSDRFFELTDGKGVFIFHVACKVAS